MLNGVFLCEAATLYFKSVTKEANEIALQAFGNLLKRMLEASGRGMWNADSDVLDKLKGMYGDLDDQLEGV